MTNRAHILRYNRDHNVVSYNGIARVLTTGLLVEELARLADGELKQTWTSAAGHYQVTPQLKAAWGH